MQFTSTKHFFDIRTALHPLLVTMGLAVLVLTTSHPAGAQQQLPPGTAGTAQAEACGWMGGVPTVEVDRTVNGIRGTWVACSIKGLGGWWCVNTPASTTCKPMPIEGQQAPSRWLEALTSDVLPVLETGTLAQMQSAVTALPATPLIQVGDISNAGPQATTRSEPAPGKDQRPHVTGKHKRGKAHRHHR